VQGVTIHRRAIHGRNIRRGADRLGKHSSLGRIDAYIFYIFRRQAGSTVDIHPGGCL
jgi:hypothetical protein